MWKLFAWVALGVVASGCSGLRYQRVTTPHHLPYAVALRSDADVMVRVDCAGLVFDVMLEADREQIVPAVGCRLSTSEPVELEVAIP